MAVSEETSNDSHGKTNGILNGTNVVNGTVNGLSKTQQSPLNRSEEVSSLVDAVKSLLVPFIKAADDAALDRSHGVSTASSKDVLVENLEPAALLARLNFSLPEGQGSGRDGVLDLIQSVLRYSVNTWDQGYLDKLCASTDAVGVASELVLAVLNTNAHVYRVSPALTVIEKVTARAVAGLFGLVGPRAGGITCQGGSASNLTSLVTARAALYPDTRHEGNGSRQFVVFASVHGHYSVEKAAVACGIGHGNVVPVPSDSEGRMDASALRELVLQAKEDGKTPLYVSATAGTTVLGAYDPLRAVSAVCKEFGMWMHVDASWGGAAIFSAKHKYKLDGSELADSLTFNPHKMLHVPATCSFLLTRDTGVFHRANTLPAGYLFHSASESEEDDIWDMADLTLQCGRRADSLKLALSWTYYGSSGFETAVDNAFATTAHFASLIDAHSDFTLVSTNPPPCLQVCFYYTPNGQVGDAAESSRRTREISARLVDKGFMVDYAPGPVGSLFRVAFNLQTLVSTVEGLVLALAAVGRDVVPV